MFIMMADVQLKEGAENDFKTLFSESNKVLSPFPGFVSRRFLKSPDGSYRIIVEHETQETFMTMILHGEKSEKKVKCSSVTGITNCLLPMQTTCKLMVLMNLERNSSMQKK